MSDNKYKLQFNKLCVKLGLGKLVKDPVPVTGGYLHKMFKVQTTVGEFAIKAINPNIIIRPKAMKNYIDSEQIAKTASLYISTAPARRFNGNAIQELDGQYYLIYDWIEGCSLRKEDVQNVHTEKMGTLLAKLHNIDFSKINLLPTPAESSSIEWDIFLKSGSAAEAVWYKKLLDNIDMIREIEARYNGAQKILSSNQIISHGDMDPKNVMWVNDDPVVIDWESAGYINPMVDLFKTAVDWSAMQDGNINEDKFKCFFRCYKKVRSFEDVSWSMVIDAGNYLGWLEYSLKRSCRIECSDDNEQKLGTEQAVYSINNIISYREKMKEVRRWIEEVSYDS